MIAVGARSEQVVEMVDRKVEGQQPLVLIAGHAGQFERIAQQPISLERLVDLGWEHIQA